MRKITWLAPVLALLLGSCGGKPTDSEVAHPALWAVKDADTTIYLFGTVHMLPADLRWFEGGVKQAFEQSDSLVLELVMPSDAEMQGLVQELGIDPASPALPDQLPSAETDKFRAALADAGQPAGALDHAEPWLAATVLSSLPLRKLGYDDKAGAETVLSDAAKAAGKPVTGLETARQQLGYFDTLPLPAQRAMLIDTLDDLPQAGATVNRMVAAWRKGDAPGLAAVMNEDMDRSPELEQALLVNRNRRWAEWIAKRMARPGTIFVAVGAGHLAGAKSVQAELAKRGLKVERLADWLPSLQGRGWGWVRDP